MCRDEIKTTTLSEDQKCSLAKKKSVTLVRTLRFDCKGTQI